MTAIVAAHENEARRPESRHRTYAALMVGLVAAMLMSLTLGYKVYSLGEVWAALIGHESSETTTVIAGLRLPRALIAPLAGAALGMAGVLVQTLSRNRIASPDTLGLNAGASLAVVLAVKAPVKALFGRTWPDTFYHNNPSYPDHGVYGFLPLQWQVAYWAFPSGHSAQIIAITVALALHKPKLAWFFAPLSVIVMGDLVALNYHWLSDVLGGILLGASVAFIVKQLAFLDQLDQWRARRARDQQPRHSSRQR